MRKCQKRVTIHWWCLLYNFTAGKKPIFTTSKNPITDSLVDPNLHMMMDGWILAIFTLLSHEKILMWEYVNEIRDISYYKNWIFIMTDECILRAWTWMVVWVLISSYSNLCEISYFKWGPINIIFASNVTDIYNFRKMSSGLQSCAN